jgi:uncharacterized protein (TIGR02246 family)
MAGQLEQAANELFSAFEAKDSARLTDLFSEDAQGVDEISRRWIRGRDELEAYLRQLIEVVSDVQTELRDAREASWGETGLLTCWLEQSYTHEGRAQHVSAPTTIVFRRENGTWKAALFHSIPIPEQTQG